MATDDTVPAMPIVSNFVTAPGADQITSAADVGARSHYCTQLHASRVAGNNVSDTALGEAICIVIRAANFVNKSANNSDLLERVDTRVGALAADLGVVKADLGELKADVGDVKAELGGVKAMLIEIKAGQNNIPHRNFNGMNRMGEHELQPLKAETGENVGQYPPRDLFPATLNLIASLSKFNLDALEGFYGIAFEGKSLAVRQANFKSFIGAS